MSTPRRQYKYLDRRLGSSYKQLFIKDRGIAARTLYGKFVRDENPMTMEEIAADYSLPLKAAWEAIAYCESDPPEIAEDFAREEAAVRAAGRDKPPFAQRCRSS